MGNYPKNAETQIKASTKSAFEWAEDLVIAFSIVCILFTFIMRNVTVDGSSMVPNFYDGERVLITGQARDLDQGDVVVIANVHEDGPIIKRILATEGQTVDFDRQMNAIVVDGSWVDDRQFGVENGITQISDSEYMLLNFPIDVPEGCVFVLGDNRTNSLDSRILGVIDSRNILGKAFFRIYPMDRIGKIE